MDAVRINRSKMKGQNQSLIILILSCQIIYGNTEQVNRYLFFITIDLFADRQDFVLH